MRRARARGNMLVLGARSVWRVWTGVVGRGSSGFLDESGGWMGGFSVGIGDTEPRVQNSSSMFNIFHSLNK